MLSINSNVVGIGSLIYYDNLYSLDTITSYQETLHASSCGTKQKLNQENSRSLWNKWLGHISKPRIERLASNGILNDIDFIDFDVCIECIKGKQTKVKNKSAHKSSKVLDLIHTDICGSFPTPS